MNSDDFKISFLDSLPFNGSDKRLLGFEDLFGGKGEEG